jgi:hypothetical protein
MCKEYQKKKKTQARHQWLIPVNLSLEVEIGRIMVPGQPGQKKKFGNPIPREKTWVWWHVPVITVMAGSIK